MAEPSRAAGPGPAAGSDSAPRVLPVDPCAQPVGARVVGVAPESPADDAGFEPGCFVTSVDGEPLRDIIDWRWLSGGEECIVVGYVDLDGEAGEVELWRDSGEDWGFEFEGLVFDGVRQCRNACTFCFMRMLPRGMRPSLYLRDDDFRLSFLVGTFVTLTNLTPEDERRIIAQRISPLRFSLQVSDPDVRRRLIGRHARHGIEAAERLLAAGIRFHAQIVLVPGENDGAVLEETLEWAYARPGILGVGIVPLGYTRFQEAFDHSFNDREASRSVLELVRPFQERAQAERGHAWVFAADEFYRNAYGSEVVRMVPPAELYGDYSMFEDGIGIIRSTVDDWRQAAGGPRPSDGASAAPAPLRDRAPDGSWAAGVPHPSMCDDGLREQGLIGRCAAALRAKGVRAVMVAGCAQREFLSPLVEEAGIGDVFEPLYVRNEYFGGNVDVTGLLVGADIAQAVRRRAAQDAEASRCVFLVPRVVFNDDGAALDGATLEDMEKSAGQPLHVVSCSPIGYFAEITELVQGA